jgi:hypothetical protein
LPGGEKLINFPLDKGHFITGVNVNYSGKGIGSYMLTKATDVYDEVIDDELVLHEYGYEIKCISGTYAD